MPDALDKLLKKRKILRIEDLYRIKMTPHRVASAVRQGRLVRTTYGAAGEIQGLYEHPDAAMEAEHDECVAFLVTGGVLCGEYAGMKHGFATCLPDEMSLLVDHATAVKPRSGMKLVRTRRTEPLTVGVEEVPTDLGVPYRITSRARTVVDLLRAKGRNDEQYGQGLKALYSHLDGGGTPSELMQIAGKVASVHESWLAGVVETAANAHGEIMGQLKGM